MILQLVQRLHRLPRWQRVAFHIAWLALGAMVLAWMLIFDCPIC